MNKDYLTIGIAVLDRLLKETLRVSCMPVGAASLRQRSANPEGRALRRAAGDRMQYIRGRLDSPPLQAL
jgi:hypothetical protein